jgi:hypothetical protein
LEEAGVEVGRDRFFEVLAEADLLVMPKPGMPRTTNSRHLLAQNPVGFLVTVA